MYIGTKVRRYVGIQEGEPFWDSHRLFHSSIAEPRSGPTGSILVIISITMIMVYHYYYHD